MEGLGEHVQVLTDRGVRGHHCANEVERCGSDILYSKLLARMRLSPIPGFDLNCAAVGGYTTGLGYTSHLGPPILTLARVFSESVLVSLSEGPHENFSVQGKMRRRLETGDWREIGDCIRVWGEFEG